MKQSQITEDYIILDTNVLLLDPSAYIKFANRHVVIPLIVIEELDSFKRELTSIGKAAREIIRSIDVLRAKGRITEGVKLENGAIIQVYILQNYEALPEGLDHAIKDNYILSAALQIHKQTGRSTALVTKDADLRIKADVLGITAWDYQEDGVQGDQLYSGEQTIQVNDDLINRFFKGELISWKDIQTDIQTVIQENDIQTNDIDSIGRQKSGLLTNQYLTLKSDSSSALVRCGRDGYLRPLIERQNMSVKPRNREQRFALDALLDPDIRLVTIAGKAGTGKTLIAIAAGLELVLSDQRYRKLLVARPVVPMGKDLGFLPGELSEKLRPWMQPIYDNLDFILGDTKNRDDKNEKFHAADSKEKLLSASNKKSESTVQYLQQAELIDVEPLTYIRGRSIPYQYMIIDEAQNLSPHEAKTIITRAGEGTKVVFTGDFYQIDHPYLNQYTNGLSFTFNRMKGQSLFAHITLDKGERSELAELASKLMEG